MPHFQKITCGFVIQTFNDKGECIHQNFVAGDDVDYLILETNEEIDANKMPLQGKEYFTYDMVQPD